MGTVKPKEGIMRYCILFVVNIVLGASAVFGADSNPVEKKLFALSPEYAVPIQVIPNEILSSRQEDTIYYCSLTNYTGIGLTAGGTFLMAIRLTPVQLGYFANYNIIALAWYDYDGSSTHGFVKVVSDGVTLDSTPYSGGIIGWHRVDLLNPVPIDSNADYWCEIEVNHPAGGHPGGVDAGPTIPDADWIYFNGSWGTLAGYGLPYNWNFLVIVEPAPGVEEKKTGRANQTFGFAPGNISHAQGQVWISYMIDRPGHVMLDIYDEAGVLVTTLVNKNDQAGLNTAYWDCSRIPAGVYFLRLEAESKTASAKLVVVK
jgi:hypothetical protein